MRQRSGICPGYHTPSNDGPAEFDHQFVQAGTNLTLEVRYMDRPIEVNQVVEVKGFRIVFSVDVQKQPRGIDSSVSV